MRKLLIVLLSSILYPLSSTIAFAQSDLGKISPPKGLVPSAGADPSGFISTLVQNGLGILLWVSFILALIWTIINGIRFVLAQGDEKTVSSAWSQISWTLIGMVVILGSFAIIKLVETFFGVNILSTGLNIPQLH